MLYGYISVEGYVRKVRDIGKQIKKSANPEAERAGNFESPHRVFHIVQNVIDV